MSSFEHRCSLVFGHLRITPLRLLRRVIPKLEASWSTELYVVVSALLPLFLLALWRPCGLKGRVYSPLILCLGIWVVYSVLIELTNILLFDRLRSEKKGSVYVRIGTVRSIVLAGFNYVQVLGWFSVFYRNWHGSFAGCPIDTRTFVGSLYYSVVTMTTLGYGDIRPITLWGASIVMAQTFMGLFMVVFVFGSFISLLSQEEKSKSPQDRTS